MSKQSSKSKTVAAIGMLALTMSHVGAHAADNAEASQENPGAEKEFNISEGSLDEALIEFSTQSEIVVVVPSSVTSGKTASGAKGEMTPDEAVETLLEGTGLEFSRDESGITIQDPNESDGDASTAEGEVLAAGEPMAMLQYAESRDDIAGEGGGSGSASSSTESTVELTGSVVDSRTGSSLKGAIIRIADLNLTTKTDDLGRFRFASVMAGRHTVSASYLGYDDVDADVFLTPGQHQALNLVMTGGAKLDEIIVFGNRSSRALSLNQQRTAENASSVVSADMLGNFEGTTIAEALRRVPGIAFEQGEFTSDGVNVTVRGLQADMNSVKLNGVELPEPKGIGRTADLSNILADSVDKITIHKSLLPSHDSGGTGGLIEIETKSPLDRKRRFVQFGVEHGQTGAGFQEENLYTGTISGTFGAAEDFGLSLSVQYRDSSNDSIRTNAGYDWGQYLPLGPNGNPSINNVQYLDPSIDFPFDPGADEAYQNRIFAAMNSAQVETLSATVSLEKQFGEHTNLRLDFTNSQREDTVFQLNSSFSARTGYSLRPVQELGGEMRQALGITGQHSAFHSYELADGGDTDTNVITLNGLSNLGKLQLKYRVGYTKGELYGGNLINLSLFNLVSSFSTPLEPFLLPEATDATEGVVLSAFPSPAGGVINMPLLNDAGWAYYNDPASYNLSQAAVSADQGGENSREVADLSAKYEFDGGPVRYLEAGISYEASNALNYGNTERTNYRAASFFSTVDAAGISEFDAGDTAATRIGFDRGFHLLSQNAVLAFANQLPELAQQPNSFFAPPNFSNARADLPNTYTDEDELAAFVQTRVDIGKLELIGGFRMSRTGIDAVQLNAPEYIDENGVFDQAFSDEFTRVERDSATDTRWLPRMLANYRSTDNLVFRAGYFKSVARPSILDLSNSNNVRLFLQPSFGPGGDQPQLNIRSGNPELAPSFTDNFDFSAEYYFGDIGLVKLGLFHKRISNLLENNELVTSESSQLEEILEGVQMPDDPRFDIANLPANLYVVRTTPQNSEFEGKIWGVEVEFERQLTFLPGFWNGFGVYTNFTYSESNKDASVPWFSKPVFDGAGSIVDFVSSDVIFEGVAFDRSPRRSGTFALTYNKYWLDASLSYTYQSERKSETNRLPVVFSDEVDSLDLRAEYWFEKGPLSLRVFLEGSDLLNGTNDPTSNTVIGPGGRYQSGNAYFGGRSVRIGITGTY